MDSLNNYISWMEKKKLGFSDKELEDYNFLSMDLIKMEFRYTHPMDENRAIDGLKLRQAYYEETGSFIGPSSGILEPCTVLEMMVALALRWENQFMRDPEKGNQGKKWFFEMLNNLGLLDCTNKNYQYGSEKLILRAIEGFLNRDIDKNGVGGLFPLKSSRKNQKNEQIWNQMMAYLTENYIHSDDSKFVLYSVDGTT